MIEGGTSVNTIAENASFLYEYRSDSAECIEKMKCLFTSAVEDFSRDKSATVKITPVGERPCENGVDPLSLSAMTERVREIYNKHSVRRIVEKSGSTDSNIPMSLGIPSVTLGVYTGEGAHTREEKILIESIPVGMKIAAELMLEYFE
jgi:di/tripeptidase